VYLSWNRSGKENVEALDLAGPRTADRFAAARRDETRVADDKDATIAITHNAINRKLATLIIDGGEEKD
jgi:hypothetical protein